MISKKALILGLFISLVVLTGCSSKSVTNNVVGNATVAAENIKTSSNIIENTTNDDDKILVQQGLHWHSELAIYINGKKEIIPADVGERPEGHLPIHTHKIDNIIHLEFKGVVKNYDTQLARFFEIWGKPFNSQCIFDHCVDEKHSLKMLVNGKENSDWEKYYLRDSDKIEIRYETIDK